MSTSNLFGRIVTGRQVRLAFKSHIELWFPTYIAEVSRIEGRGASLPGFRSYVSALDLQEGKFEEHQMPSCVIVAPGLLTEPEKRGGTLSATWAVSVGCVVAGQDRDNTFELAEMYAAAVRSAVMQNPSIGGFSGGTDWLGERYDEIPNDMLRTLAAGTVHFSVQVMDSMEFSAGPDVPLVDPSVDPGSRATFVSVEATVEGITT